MIEASETPWRGGGRAAQAARLMVFAFLTLGLVFGVAAAAQGQSDGDGSDQIEDLVDVSNVVPSLVALVEAEIDETEAKAALPGLLSEIERVPGVVRAAGEGRSGGFVVYVTNVDDDVGNSWLGDDIEASINEFLDDSEHTVTFGGRAAFERSIISSYRRSLLGIVLVGLLAAAYALVRFGWRGFAAVGIGAVVSVPLSSELAARLVGPFDGTLATTILPGALAALVVVVSATLAFIRWFEEAAAESTEATVGSDRITTSIFDVASRFGLPLMAVLVGAGVAEIAGGGRSALLTVSIGAITALILTCAIVPFVLDGSRTTPLSVEPASQWLASIDGRNFGIGLLGLFVLVLTILAGFGWGTGSGGLLRPTDLDRDSRVATAERFLLSQGADPTEALAVVLPAEASPVERDRWVADLVSEPSVAWVDIGTKRFLSGSAIDVDDAHSLIGPALLDRSDNAALDRLAIVVPSKENVALGSSARVDLADQLAETRVGDQSLAAIELPRPPTRSTARVLSAILALAAAIGLALYMATGGLGVALTGLVLQLLEGAAVVGIFRLLVPSITEAELLTGLGVISVATMLISVELVTELTQRPELRWSDQAHALDATLGLATLLAAAVALPPIARLGGGPLTSRLGICLAVSAVVVLIAGVLALRPALLAQRWQFHRLARPLRIYQHSGLDRRSAAEPIEELDPRWSRIISTVIAAEHDLERSPGKLPLDNVFHAETAVYSQAEERQQTMIDAGVQVEGEAPRLVSVRPLAENVVSKVLVITDQPDRSLIDENGRLLGRRVGERKTGVLWLVVGPDEGWRVVESIERSSKPIGSSGDVPVVDLNASTLDNRSSVIELEIDASRDSVMAEADQADS